MYELNSLLERARLLEAQNKRPNWAETWELPETPGIGQSLRQSAGDALISLGTRIKPRKQNSNLKLNSARLAGR